MIPETTMMVPAQAKGGKLQDSYIVAAALDASWLHANRQRAIPMFLQVVCLYY